MRSIEEILEAAYLLQDNSEKLFIHQNSVLNKRALDFLQPAEVARRDDVVEASPQVSEPSQGTRSRTVSQSRGSGRHAALSVSTLEEVGSLNLIRILLELVFIAFLV